MTLEAGALINAARDIHPAFDDRRHPPKVLLRFLSRYQRELVGRAVEADKSAIVAFETIPFPLADHEAGHTLPEFYNVHGGDVTFANESKTELLIIPWGHRIDPVPYYSAYLDARTLHFRGSAGEWNAVVELVVRYTPLPAELTTLSGAGSQLVLPDSAEAACVDALGMFMARKGHAVEGLPPIPVADLTGAAGASESKWLQALGARRRGKVSYTREVW